MEARCPDVDAGECDSCLISWHNYYILLGRRLFRRRERRWSVIVPHQHTVCRKADWNLCKRTAEGIDYHNSLVNVSPSICLSSTNGSLYGTCITADGRQLRAWTKPPKLPRESTRGDMVWLFYVIRWTDARAVKGTVSSGIHFPW